jgi:methionyl-tRNA formyltransferase
MKVEEGLDTGPVYAERRLPLDDDADIAAVRDQLVEVGAGLLVTTLAGGLAGLPVPVPQRGEATTATKINAEDLHLDWTQPAGQLRRVVRLGRAWTTFRGKRLRVLEAGADAGALSGAPPGTLVGASVATGAGAVRLVRVQPEGRSPMSAEEWLRGSRPSASERLGSD